ncbi:MAG: response regulator [Deltaproteobacteria bacterium]|nr:MAG: response regulator [Deltaproteobacteria bacterium]
MNQGQRGLRILVVDDSPAVSDILSQLCKFLGHEVICAENGAEGLSRMQAEARIDMVFTDYKMPVMDGLEMTRRIKSRCPDMPVVLITGSVVIPDEDVEHTSFDAVVQKPFELNTIAESISRLFPH